MRNSELQNPLPSFSSSTGSANATSTKAKLRDTLVAVTVLSLTVITLWHWPSRAAASLLPAPSAQTTVATVSAASFASVLAPDSLAAAFGLRLATRTEAATSQPLPTRLADTTVKINGQLAPLFFVSPGQINFLIPTGTPSGIATVIVTAGDGTVSTGTVQIATNLYLDA